MFGRCIWWVPLEWQEEGERVQRKLGLRTHRLHMTGKSKTGKGETARGPKEVRLLGGGRCTLQGRLGAIELFSEAIFEEGPPQRGHVSLGYRWGRGFEERELEEALRLFRPGPSPVGVEVWVCDGPPEGWRRTQGLCSACAWILGCFTRKPPPRRVSQGPKPLRF